MTLLFLNLGVAELILIFFVLLIPFILMVYAVFDILKSKFKENNSQILFLLLVLILPFIGSIIYIALRKNYKAPQTNPL